MLFQTWFPHSVETYCVSLHQNLTAYTICMCMGVVWVRGGLANTCNFQYINVMSEFVKHLVSNSSWQEGNTPTCPFHTMCVSRLRRILSQSIVSKQATPPNHPHTLPSSSGSVTPQLVLLSGSLLILARLRPLKLSMGTCDIITSKHCGVSHWQHCYKKHSTF